MYLDNISPYIRLACNNIMASTITLPERVIFDYELLYIKCGHARIRIEKDVYDGSPGDIFLFKPKQKHSIQSTTNETFHQPHIHFDFFQQPDSASVKVSFKPLEEMSKEEIKHFREDVTANSPVPIPNKLYVSNIKVFEEMLFNIIYEYEMKLPFSEANAKGLFIQLWIYLLREMYWVSNPVIQLNYDMLINIKNYINLNIDKDITLEQLSEVARLSKYHLERLFRKMFNVSPIHYHKMMRVNKGKEMIQFSNLSISEIAEKLGFDSIHTFSRTFKNVEGVPPSFYRKGF